MSISWTAGPPPDAMKDGRYVLVWAGEAIVARWIVDAWWWDTCSWIRHDDITHWSEANQPEGAE